MISVTCLQPCPIDSDRGTEFMNSRLQKFCDDHGIRKTATAGYDPAANGAGENAIGFIKRKARQLIIGSSLPTSWWGVASLAAASYTRCAAELDQWPTLPFGVRAMVVQDPPERNAFMPRSLPCTVFGPSDEVSGGYYIYQQGRVKQAVNVK